jgi:hypothetical protein
MRSLALIACLAATLTAGEANAQSARSLERADDLRCGKESPRRGSPAYKRCRAALVRMRADTVPPRSRDRRFRPAGSGATPLQGITPSVPLSPPPVVRTPPPVFVTPSLPRPPAIIGGPDPQGGYPVIPGPPPVVETPPPVRIGPAN